MITCMKMKSFILKYASESMFYDVNIACYQGAKVMRLCVQNKDEGRGRCVSWNGVCGGEYER